MNVLQEEEEDMLRAEKGLEILSLLGGPLGYAAGKLQGN